MVDLYTPSGFRFALRRPKVEGEPLPGLNSPFVKSLLRAGATWTPPETELFTTPQALDAQTGLVGKPHQS